MTLEFYRHIIKKSELNLIFEINLIISEMVSTVLTILNILFNTNF